VFQVRLHRLQGQLLMGKAIIPLEPNAKKRVRLAIADFCARAEASRLKWHYTQARRFGGFGVKPEEHHANDCSGYVSLAFNWAMMTTGVFLDDPLGEHYTGWGYTGTLYEFLKAHPAPEDKYLVGDIAIFGTPSHTVHTSICRKAGTEKTAIFSSNGHESWSFGSDAPNQTTLEGSHQHLVGVFRHPALL
jgi:hypothetical protein